MPKIAYLNSKFLNKVPKLYTYWQDNDQGYILMENLCFCTPSESKITEIVNDIYDYTGWLHGDTHKHNIMCGCNVNKEIKIIDWGISFNIFDSNENLKDNYFFKYMDVDKAYKDDLNFKLKKILKTNKQFIKVS